MSGPSRPERPPSEAPRERDPVAGLAPGPRQKPGEVNGPKGPEPTRFGDWEKDGRCSDF